MNREDFFGVGKILALALMLGVALVTPFIVGAKIYNVVAGVEPSEALEAAGAVDAPVRPDPERWKASVFSPDFDGEGGIESKNGDLDLPDGEDLVALEDLLYCIRQGFLVYDAAEKRWMLSDQFLEDVADALVPVLKERGSFLADNEFGVELKLETSP